MWDKRKVLLTAILFTVFYHKETAGNGKLLDTTMDVIDDLYDGCRQQAMETFILSGLLEQELNESAGFQRAWSSNTQCSTLIAGGIKEHTAALSAYYNGDDVFLKTFDYEVETMGLNITTYREQFHFKSLHFLLMDSMRLLKPKKCQTMFLLLDEEHVPQKGSTVRFGSFTLVTSSYAELKKMEDFADQIILNITSCFFVNAGDHICSKDKDLVLLSPAEVFTVEEVNTKDEEDYTYTEIALKHLNMNSTHNCYIFSRSPAVISTQWLVSVLVTLSFLSLTV